MKEKLNEKFLEVIKEAIDLGFSWACNECHRNKEKCPIAKVAKKFDDNFKEDTCSFDTEKVINGIIHFIKILKKF